MSSIAQRIGVHLSRDWLRIATELIAIGVLVWLFFWSSVNESRLTALEQRVDGLDLRVSRIAAEMPELRQRLAYESVFLPFGTAVFTLPPAGLGQTQMTETIFVIEASSGAVTQYRLTWTREDPGMALAIAGALRTLDPRAIPITDEERMAQIVKQPAVRLPPIDRDQSFVLYQPATAVFEQLQKIGAKKEGQLAVSPVLNWAQLARVLETSTWLKPPANSGAPG